MTAADAIAKAKPFIDAGVPPSRWRPSELLTIGWSTIASRAGVGAADEYVTDMLADARDRWAAGFRPNPFEEPPVREERKATR